jgi:hypothetical protein
MIIDLISLDIIIVPTETCSHYMCTRVSMSDTCMTQLCFTSDYSKSRLHGYDLCQHIKANCMKRDSRKVDSIFVDAFLCNLKLVASHKAISIVYCYYYHHSKKGKVVTVLN